MADAARVVTSRTRTVALPTRLDLAAILSRHRRGAGDPSFVLEPGRARRASHTPDGPGGLDLRWAGRCPDRVEAAAYGPGAEWLLDQLPGFLGLLDAPDALETTEEPIATWARRGRVLRISRTDRVFEALAPAIIEQKVTGREAWRGWRHLLLEHGEPAPGLPELRVPMPRPHWAQIPSWDWHKAGLEPRRLRTMAAAAAVDVERLTAAQLTTRPGIGPWTVAETVARAHGDPDAVSVGDYHLAAHVGVALTGAKVDDDTMLELLEPYRGQRGRVIGYIRHFAPPPQRRGPRMPTRDYRRF